MLVSFTSVNTGNTNDIQVFNVSVHSYPTKCLYSDIHVYILLFSVGTILTTTRMRVIVYQGQLDLICNNIGNKLH